MNAKFMIYAGPHEEGPGILICEYQLYCDHDLYVCTMRFCIIFSVSKQVKELLDTSISVLLP